MIEAFASAMNGPHRTKSTILDHYPLWSAALSVQHVERDQRYPFESDVQLLVSFHPWFLRLCLQGVNMSTSGVLAAMNPQNLGPGIGFDDLSTLLNEGDAYQVQLTSAFDHIESPVLNVRLRRKKFHSNNLKVAFSFEDQNEQLFGLIHELKQVTRRFAVPTQVN